MEKELFDYVSERVGTIAESSASTQQTAEMAKAWQAAVSADPAAADVETEKLLDYLSGRMKTTPLHRSSVPHRSSACSSARRCSTRILRTSSCRRRASRSLG